MNWKGAVFGLCVAALLGGGCGVTSDHPLTDEQTSVIDARLIGVWEGVPKLDEAKYGKKPSDPPRVFVGRVDGSGNTLEAVFLQLEKERVKVERFRLFATKLGSHRYVSAGRSDAGYAILLYDLQEPDRLTLHVMKEDVFAAAVDKGLLAGNVTRKQGEGPLDIEIKTVRLEATPEELAAFLQAHSPACYEMEEPATLRRLDLD